MTTVSVPPSQGKRRNGPPREGDPVSDAIRLYRRTSHDFLLLTVYPATNPPPPPKNEPWNRSSVPMNGPHLIPPQTDAGARKPPRRGFRSTFRPRTPTDEPHFTASRHRFASHEREVEIEERATKFRRMSHHFHGCYRRASHVLPTIEPRKNVQPPGLTGVPGTQFLKTLLLKTSKTSVLLFFRGSSDG